MSLRPRSNSIQPPTIDSSHKLPSTGPSSPTHAPSYPLLLISSLNIRICALTAHKKGHFFVTVQLRKDDIVLESLPRNRTEVSTDVQDTMHFAQNIFNFDTRTLAMPRSGSTPAPGPRPPFLLRSGSSLSSVSLIAESLKGIDLHIAVYQVIPNEDDEHGFTKVVAKGHLPLHTFASQPGFHLKEENEEDKLHASSDIPARLTRQGSSASSVTLDDSDSDDFGVPALITLLEVEEEDAENTSDNRGASDRPLVVMDFEESEFGSITIRADFRKRSSKEHNRPKKNRNPPILRESPIGLLVSQHGLSRYYNGSNSESQEFSLRCYGVYNLPTQLRTFLTLKTTEDVKLHQRARANTPTSPPTCNYSWSDTLVVTIHRQQRGSDSRVGLFLSLVDYLKKTHVAKCIIPVEAVIPGEQYNFAIVINNEGSCMYVSLSLESNLVFQSNMYSRHPELCCLEVLLHGVQRIRPASAEMSDPFPSTSYLAVLHFESDLRKYLKSMSLEPPKLPCQPICLDHPSAMDHLTPSAYRISPPSQPSLYPQWNCLFELSQAVDDLFAPNAVLIVEVFEICAPKDAPGSIDFLAWTSVPLAQLTQPGMRDGSIARHTSILHMSASVMNAPQEPCDMHSECAPHEFSLLVEMRRWSSRYYSRHKQQTIQQQQHQQGQQQQHHLQQPLIVTSDYLDESGEELPSNLRPDQIEPSIQEDGRRELLIQDRLNGNDETYTSRYLRILRRNNPPPLPPPRKSVSNSAQDDSEEILTAQIAPAGVPSLAGPTMTVPDLVIEPTSARSDCSAEFIGSDVDGAGSEASASSLRDSRPEHSTIPLSTPEGLSRLRSSSSSSSNNTALSPVSSQRMNGGSIVIGEDTTLKIPDTLSHTEQVSGGLSPNQDSSESYPDDQRSQKSASRMMESETGSRDSEKTLNSSRSAHREVISLPVNSVLHRSNSNTSIGASSTVGGGAGQDTSPSSALSSSPSIPRSTTTNGPLRVSIPAIPFNMGPFSAGAVPVAAPTGVLFQSPLSPTVTPQHFSAVSTPQPYNTTTSTPHNLSPLMVPSQDAANYATPLQTSRRRGTISQPHRLDRRLPDVNSPEAERNRRLLEMRVAELDLETAPESPEKRVLTVILPQVRSMVTRSATTLAKAALAEHRMNSLQSENNALKRQVQRLLAARGAGVSLPTKSAAAAAAAASSSTDDVVSPEEGTPRNITEHEDTMAANPAPLMRSFSTSSVGAPAVPPRPTAHGTASSSPAPSKRHSHFEYSDLMTELTQLIESSEKFSKDHQADNQQLAEHIAAKMSEDFATNFASCMERLKSEFKAAGPSHSPTTPTAVTTPSTVSFPTPLESNLISELKSEVEHLKHELEQSQMKYLLTSAAFGEEVLLLRSKLKERKHQLQEVKKHHGGAAGGSHQKPSAPGIHPQHYVALSPIATPSSPNWHPRSQTSSTTSSFNGSVSQTSLGSASTSTMGDASSASHRHTKSPRSESITQHFSYATSGQSPQLAHVPPPFENQPQSPASGKLPARR